MGAGPATQHRFWNCGQKPQGPLVSDNGPQFVAAEFQKLTKEWDIEHRVTSPYNSKANGKVDAAVKSAKKLLRRTAKGGNDFYLGLLAERNIPSQGIGSSPGL